MVPASGVPFARRTSTTRGMVRVCVTVSPCPSPLSTLIRSDRGSSACAVKCTLLTRLLVTRHDLKGSGGPKSRRGGGGLAAARAQGGCNESDRMSTTGRGFERADHGVALETIEVVRSRDRAAAQGGPPDAERAKLQTRRVGDGEDRCGPEERSPTVELTARGQTAGIHVSSLNICEREPPCHLDRDDARHVRSVAEVAVEAVAPAVGVPGDGESAREVTPCMHGCEGQAALHESWDAAAGVGEPR